MARLEKWQSNLGELIEDARHKPFDFPKWNCLLWAFAAVEAVTGEDYTIDFAGKFKDEMSAAKLMRKLYKVKSSQSLLEIYLGETKPIAFARKGDIVLANPDEVELQLPSDMDFFGLVPGVCYGSTSFFVGEKGLVQTNTLSLGKTLWVS